jgi:hypothetical protein
MKNRQLSPGTSPFGQTVDQYFENGPKKDCATKSSKVHRNFLPPYDLQVSSFVLLDEDGHAKRKMH